MKKFSFKDRPQLKKDRRKNESRRNKRKSTKWAYSNNNGWHFRSNWKYYERNKTNSNFRNRNSCCYSAICFSKFLEKGGFIDTIERDKERIKEAKENIKIVEEDKTINILEGDAVEILPTINKKYDMVFIDAAKGKYPFFLEQALRLIKDDGIIFADNILYKGYVMSDYNKHKQRTAVTHLREYIKLTTDNPKLDTQILEVGDGLAITRLKKSLK